MRSQNTSVLSRLMSGLLENRPFSQQTKTALLAWEAPKPPRKVNVYRVSVILILMGKLRLNSSLAFPKGFR
jgi:hypothetical protein